MATKPRVLVILSSQESFDFKGEKKPTGWYLPEFSHPYDVVKDKVDLVIASSKGGAAPIDPSSIEATKEDKISVDFLKNKSALWENTHKLEEFLGKEDQFDAIFYVGGVGPMWDLAHNSTSHELIANFEAKKKILSAVCHGPAAFAFAKGQDGKYILEGESVTGFSNSEEAAVGYTEAMPFSLEDELNKASGGKFTKAEQDWGAKIVTGRGGRLITGQNPASAKGVGEALLKSLGL